MFKFSTFIKKICHIPLLWRVFCVVGKNERAVVEEQGVGEEESNSAEPEWTSG